MFKLQFDTANAAFEGEARSEIERILQDIADKINSSEVYQGNIRDVNGNTIGSWNFIPDIDD